MRDLPLRIISSREYNLYQDWILSDVLRLHSQDIYNNRVLLNLLNTIVFDVCPNVPMDENRKNDVYHVRRGYREARGVMIEWDPTVLEVLVAFADRIEDSYIGDPKHPEPFRIFIEMLRNLGLWNHEIESEKNYFYQKVQDFLTRNYRRNGQGGLFPLRHPKRDQRTIELWDQMLAYINENQFKF